MIWDRGQSSQTSSIATFLSTAAVAIAVSCICSMIGLLDQVQSESPPPFEFPSMSKSISKSDSPVSVFSPESCERYAMDAAKLGFSAYSKAIKSHLKA